MADEVEVVTLTKDEMKELIKEAVGEAFTKLGIDANDPLEMQRDFQHLREWRLAVAAMRTKGMLTIIGIVVAGSVAAFWLGVKSTITGAP